MNALTAAERQRLIAAGFKIEFPTHPKRTVITYQAPPRKIALPIKKFQGTPKERADYAVELAETGKYALTEICKACGYSPAVSVALKELVAGQGPLINLCHEAARTGRVRHSKGMNTACLRIIRDFYELPNIRCQTEGTAELREFLNKLGRKVTMQVAEAAGLNPDGLRPFCRGQTGMLVATQRRVRDAIVELGLKGGAL